MMHKTYVVKLILGCTDMPDSPAARVLCARCARLNQASSGAIEKASGNDASLFEAEICGKGGQWSQLPLPPDVAKAIAHYLRHDRPRCASRRLFIRDYAPIDGFESANAIACLVKRALKRAGVVSARKGAHLLRHSLATDMLSKGASLDEIG
jgi:site-specific recombinase XerD